MIIAGILERSREINQGRFILHTAMNRRSSKKVIRKEIRKKLQYLSRIVRYIAVLAKEISQSWTDCEHKQAASMADHESESDNAG